MASIGPVSLRIIIVPNSGNASTDFGQFNFPRSWRDDSSSSRSIQSGSAS